MNDGELDFANQVQGFLNSNAGCDVPSTCSLDSTFWDGINDVYTHIHTCNQPGPDAPHIHTCHHTRTNIISTPLPAPPAEDKAEDTAESSEKKSKKCPSGNRVAVRKYREKQKAHKSSLEDEVVRLRAENKHLRMMVQGMATVEAENTRLKYLLTDFRGKIEGVIGSSFPYQKNVATPPNVPLGGAYEMNPCNNMQCNDQFYCPHPPDGGGTSGYGQGFFSGCQGNH